MTTPGTATGTPGPCLCDDEWANAAHWECNGNPEPDASGWIKCSHDGEDTCGCPRKRFAADRASKPPAPPVYGRLVGELRAPDGTPRTALEAIQAKREPEPWRPAVDEWDLLPDVDVRR